MNWWERYSKLCEKKHRSPTAAAVEAGLTQNVAVRWKQGSVPKHKETISKLCEYFGLTEDELFSDKSPEPNAEIAQNAKIRLAPLYDSCSAGFGAQAEDYIIDYLPIYTDSAAEAEDSILITVHGDSMQPLIRDGNIVQVLKTPYIESGSVGIVTHETDTGTDGFVKRIYTGNNELRLVSENEKYPPIVISGRELREWHIEGKVTRVIANL